MGLNDNILLNPDYWDCECEKNYIHEAKQKRCRKCGSRRDEMPDSRQNEIDEGTHFHKSKNDTSDNL